MYILAEKQIFIPSVFNIFDRTIKSYKNNIFIRLLKK